METSAGQEPLILDDLALPFRFELEVLQNKEKDVGNYNASMAGILIRIERESLGQLLSSYYYPTASFALLSMVSFLINPEVVCMIDIYCWLKWTIIFKMKEKRPNKSYAQ